MVYTIGEKYIWQNCSGSTSFLNGTETTVTGPLEEWVDQETLEVIWAQLTSTKCGDSKSGFFVAIEGRLGRKSSRYLSECQGKQKLGSSTIAFKIVKQRGGHAYKCRYCGSWHTSSINRLPKRAKQVRENHHGNR